MALASPRTSPVRVRGRFHRSVQLERDRHQQDEILDYLITPTVRDLTRRFVSELKRAGGTRAWSITGPYGTGKSSFTLFLTRFLADELGSHTEAKTLRAELGWRARMLPAIIVGHRAPLKAALLAGLEQAVEPISPKLAKEVRALSRASGIDDYAVAELYERAAVTVQEFGYSGLIVVIDEFGKLLEYVANNLDQEDLLIMQILAETAARSEAPLVVTTVLHTSFSAYLDGESDAQRAEWQKVQGRYTDVTFQEPAEQLLRLVGQAIETDFLKEQRNSYTELVSRVVDEAALSEARERLPSIRELSIGCLPLDPIVSLLLPPLFRSKLAQNERSLFSFLTSQEPFGFQEFLRTADWSQESSPLFRLPQLYDYVSVSLGAGIHRGEQARRWLELEDALDRISADAPRLASEVVKALGLLWIYGAQVGLKASQEVIQLALGACDEVAQAVIYLQAQSIIVFRKFENSFALWEGSDIDLDERYEEAKINVGYGSLAKRLQRAIRLRGIVARAHYITSGTLRYFEVEVVDGTKSNVRKALETPLRHGDGRITYFLSQKPLRRQELIEHALELTGSDNPNDKLRIFAFPKLLAGLEDVLQDYEAWRWIHGNTPTLHGDRVATKEVLARLRFAALRLESIAGKVLGLRGYRFEPSQADWIQGGKKHAPEDSIHFLRWLSSLCDEVFDRAPIFRNELLNRSAPSTAANTALYKLVKAMVANSDKKRFGMMNGTPPEVSMYESLLKNGGFHRPVDSKDHWSLSEPDISWQPVWREIEAFLASTHTQRRPVTDLYDCLKKPPFGMRQGPMPVLLLTMLLIKRHSVALYENGLFQPSLTEPLAEKIARNPSAFEVQEFVYDEETLELLRSMMGIASSFEGDAAAHDGSPLLRIARPLILFAARLPKYTKNTSKLVPAEAGLLRDVLLKARDPHSLLLEEIPPIFGMEARSAATTGELVQRLESSLTALRRAYPDLLDSIEQQIKSALGLRGTTSQEIRNSLFERAHRLQGLASDPKLIAFLSRAARHSVDDDWRELLGLVVVERRAPRDWTDTDRAAFQANLWQLASDFKRLEELALERKRSGANQVLRIGLLGASEQEKREIISLYEEDEPEVERLADAIREALSGYTGQNDNKDMRRIRMAALSRLILLHSTDEEEPSKT